MKIPRFMLATLLLPALALGGGEQVLSPVNVVSMIDGSIAREQAVVIKADRIVAVVPAAEIDSDHVGLVDGGGAWVIPGLAEMHAHVPPQQRGAQHAADVLALFLANGVTTIRGMLGEPWHLQLRKDLESGTVFGPRLVTSGPSFNGRTVSSPDQAARRVREQFEAGYDFVKLHPGLEADEFRAIAKTARSVGIPFAGHVSFDVGIDLALHYRQDSIDHLDGYAQEMLEEASSLEGVSPAWFGLNLATGMTSERAPQLAIQTALAGVWNVPTQSLFETTTGTQAIEALMNRPGMDYLSDSLSASWAQAVRQIREQSTTEQRARFLAARRALIAELQDAGAGLLLGSDAPQIMNVPGFSIHQELAWLVGAGLTPLQALQSGTVNVARYFGENDRGQVKAGFIADLVLIEANPLEDISASGRVLGVMRAGRWFNREHLDRLLEGVKQRGI